MALIRSGQVADYVFQVAGGSAEKFRVAAFKGTEAMSEPFLFRLELVSTDRGVDFATVVGQEATLTISAPKGKRWVHGMVSRFAAVAAGDRFVTYEAELVPTVWRLSRRADCRIFQGKSVPDIVKSVIEGAGVPASRMKLSLQATYPPRDYCVQYRETDLDFVSRLLEEEGIFYWFEHTASDDVMVMADVKDAGVALAGGAEIPFSPPGGMIEEKEHVSEFRLAQEVRSGKATLRDYNHEKPTLDLEVHGQADKELDLEVYDYPGDYADTGEGKRLVAARLDALRAKRALGTGASAVRRLLPGFRFKMSGHWHSGLNQEYLLIRVEHEGSQPQVREDEAAGGKGPLYANTFRCIPSATVFRPECRTPRPVIVGAQTATVVGPQGEEIYTDDQGRVKVQFPWDRQGQWDDKSSCWIRVSQEWAGKGWGATILPRIGHEVLVTFIEGDPDRPMVTGRVYNAVNVPPYPLPGEKTKSTLKSDSSKGGGNFNEIRLEDLAGSEQVFVHAAKDMDVRVLNDRREWVKNDRSLIVKRDRLASVERDDHATVGRDLVEEVKRDHHVKVTGKQAQEVGGSTSLKVKGDRIEVVDGAYSVKVTGDLVVKGTKIVLDASSGITLKVGGNFLTVDPSGVAIKGTLVQLNSGGSALSGSPGSPVSPVAPQAPVEAATAEPGKQPQARSASPTHAPQSSANQQKKNYIEIEMKDDEGNPMGGLRYAVVLPDGSTVADGTLDEKGYAKVENIDPGQCKVTFPDLHGDAWDNA